MVRQVCIRLNYIRFKPTCILFYREFLTEINQQFFAKSAKLCSILSSFVLVSEDNFIAFPY